MKPGLKSFVFNSYLLRVVMLDGEGWYLAQDVAQILDYDQTSNMTKRLDSDEKRNCAIMLDGVNYTNQTLINQSGLYEALFSSKKEKAKKFRRWLKREVLPETDGERWTNPPLKEEFFAWCAKKNNLQTTLKPELYVVLFNTGMIKVGKGFNGFERVKAHIKQAGCFGVKTLKFFIEKQPQITEEDLIQFCNQNGNLHCGNEYFTDLDYDLVVNFVKRKIERKLLKLVKSSV
jgi:hypothetical protein